jgi:hypothetical protein
MIAEIQRTELRQLPGSDPNAFFGGILGRLGSLSDTEELNQWLGIANNIWIRRPSPTGATARCCVGRAARAKGDVRCAGPRLSVVNRTRRCNKWPARTPPGDSVTPDCVHADAAVDAHWPNTCRTIGSNLGAPRRRRARHNLAMGLARANDGPPATRFEALANLPHELRWANRHPVLARAMAAFHHTTAELGEHVLPVEARRLVRARVSAWQGEDMGLSRRWAQDAVRRDRRRRVRTLARAPEHGSKARRRSRRSASSRACCLRRARASRRRIHTMQPRWPPPRTRATT